jgi:cysteinyl-tRNA synthetase
LKENPADFVLWKSSSEEGCTWDSQFGKGRPGWHIECSAMALKYLGRQFDIHGGGADLKFPHHENEIAQNIGACGCQPVNYWIHGNMLVLNGKKMSKSDGNYIMPRELFSGSSPLMSKAYSPMTLRFFMLQAHYRSTLNITEDAMLAAEKGLQRIMETNSILQALQYSSNDNIAELDTKINNIIDAVFDEMDNDFNTPNALAELFGLATEIQKFQNNQQPLSLISESTLKRLKETFNIVLFDIFGLKDEAAENEGSPELLDGLMEMIIDFRKEVREQKNWTKSDLIRDKLLELGVQIKDGKEGASWNKV